MLEEVSASAEKVWLGSDDEDLRQLLRDLQQVHLPDHPRQAWARLQILNHIKNCINAIELDHIKVLKQIEKGDPYGVDNAADWLAQSMHLRPNAAYAKVCTACELEEFPNLYRRVHEGELSPEATTVILQTLRRVRHHLTPEHVDVDAMEKEMLHAAQEMDHAQLRAHGSRVFHLFNREAPPGSPRNGACGVSGGGSEVLYEERERRFFDLKRRVTAGSPAAASLTRRAAPSCRSRSPPGIPAKRSLRSFVGWKAIATEKRVRSSLGRPPHPRPGPRRRAGGACRAPAGVR
jgi:hypothetical protein